MYLLLNSANIRLYVPIPAASNLALRSGLFSISLSQNSASTGLTGSAKSFIKESFLMIDT